MSFNVKVTSSRKGSNPGGGCTLYENGRKLFDAYFKYCNSSRLSKGSALVTKHQPVYEATTLTLARKFGLRTSDFYVLLNPDRKIKFDGWKKLDCGGDPNGREFYFISKMSSRPKTGIETDKGALALLQKDTPYLESLLVADVLQKRQNYAYHNYHNDSFIKYIDLGCSFVHAVSGQMTISPKAEDLSRKDTKRLVKNLSKKNIMCAREKEIINLEGLASQVKSGSVPVLNHSMREIPFRMMLGSAELEEIYDYTLQGFSGNLKDFAKRKIVL